MNEELTKQLQSFLNQGKVATYADLKEQMDFFMKLTKEVRVRLEEKLKDTTDKQDGKISDLVKFLDDSIANIQKLLDSNNNKSKSKLESNFKELKLEISRVERLIPKIPNIPDVNILEGKLVSRINSIKSLTSEDFKKIILNNGITVRDSLERLKGEERLDKSAIRGIESIEEDIKKIKAQPAFKVINVGSSSDSSSSSSDATGAATPIAPTSGAINGSNTAFVFATEVKVIVANGVAIRQNYGFTWNSGTSTATLDNAPATGTDVFGYSPVTATGRDPGVITVADATSITPSTALYKIIHQTNTQSAGTLTINADSDTPADGRAFLLRIKSTNVQTLLFNAQYIGGTTALPASTTGSGNVDYFSFIYYASTSKYHYLGPALNYLG